MTPETLHSLVSECWSRRLALIGSTAGNSKNERGWEETTEWRDRGEAENMWKMGCWERMLGWILRKLSEPHTTVLQFKKFPLGLIYSLYVDQTQHLQEALFASCNSNHTKGRAGCHGRKSRTASQPWKAQQQKLKVCEHQNKLSVRRMIIAKQGGSCILVLELLRCAEAENSTHVHLHPGAKRFDSCSERSRTQAPPNTHGLAMWLSYVVTPAAKLTNAAPLSVCLGAWTVCTAGLWGT